MATKLYVGNLPWSTSSDDLAQLFGQIGQLADAVVINDRNTGRSRGFGFVEYESVEDAQQAIQKFAGYELNGRKLVVNQAREKQPRDNFHKSF